MEHDAGALTRLPRRTIATLAAVALLVAGAMGWAIWNGGKQPSRIAPPPQAADTPPPPAPAALTAQPAVPPDPALAQTDSAAPSFDLVRVARDGGLVLAGQATPGATVTVTADDHVLAVATADSNGAWVAVPDASLAAGVAELTLSSRDAAGALHHSAVPALVVVPDRPGAAASPTPAPAMAVLVPPAGASRLLQPPTAGNAAAGKLALGTIDYDDHGAIRFSGSAPPQATVRIYVDNSALGDATADAKGRWALAPTQELAPGVHRLRLDQLGTDEQVVSRAEWPFEREVLALAQVRPGHVVVEPGQNLWRLARRVYGNALRYTLIFVANRSQIRDPRLIYPGQVFRVPKAPH